MQVLIVESRAPLAAIWSSHLERLGVTVRFAETAAEAIESLCLHPVDVIVLDLVLEGGNALTVADFAGYRRPDAKVIFVTDTDFFSDGSIFQVSPNAAGFWPIRARTEDLTALVEHHGRPN